MPFTHYVTLISSNSSVCQADDACRNFPISGMDLSLTDEAEQNMTCYKGGDTVIHNYQMCDITSEFSDCVMGWSYTNPSHRP